MRACRRIHSVFLGCCFNIFSSDVDQLSSCHNKLPCYIALVEQFTCSPKLFSSCLNKLSCRSLIEQHSGLPIKLQ